MEIYPAISPMTKPRHPKLDEYFNQWKDLVYKCAHHYAAYYKQSYEEFLGFCVLKLNECLHLWDGTKGAKFNTYYITALKHSAKNQFMKYESEHLRLIHMQHEAEKSRNSYLRVKGCVSIDNVDVAIPEEPEINYGIDVSTIMRQAIAIVTEKELYVLQQRVIHKVELRDLARKMKLNTQYVSQIYGSAVKKLRKALNK